jgi:acetyltransferase-like isoleucine patch superfamily enzyme
MQLKGLGTLMHMTNSPDNWKGVVSPGAQVATSTKIWDNAQVREGAKIGSNCIIGRGVYIGAGVVLGNNCKIQNHAMVYEPAILEDGVFIGPNVVLTNDHYPRAINPDGTLKSVSDWEPVGVTIRTGASIGAHSVCIAPVVVGSWVLVGSGSVVTKDVPDHALVVGNPARQIGWVSKSGHKLNKTSTNNWTCPKTGAMYHKDANGVMREIAS